MPLDEVTLLKQEIAVLRAQIEWLKKQLFGSGKSETLDRAQLLLKLGELEKLAASVEAPKQTITYERPVSREKRPLPAESFAHLPVQERVVIEPALVQAEPEAYERIGEERTFEVDVVPPKLFKREIVRPKYRHRLDRNRRRWSLPPRSGPWPAATPRRGCSPGSLSVNTSITLRFTGSNRCRRDGAPRSRASRWPTGSGSPPGGWSRSTGG